MKTFAALTVLLFTLAPAPAGEDLTGKWSGTFTIINPDDGAVMEESGIVMNLTHKGKDLTGTVGPNADTQWPILKGLVDADKLTFDVQSGDSGPTVHFTLTFANGRLKGGAAGEQDGRKLAARIDAGRDK